MPVECNVELLVFDQPRFHEVDEVVMRKAFDIHNTLGRFCDEEIYKEELAERCREVGLDVRREVVLTVSHKMFNKRYFMDFLVNKGVVYELKTVKALNGNHERQLINYLLLAGLKHGKLINFRPSSVEYRFVSTSLGLEDRTDFNLVDVDFNCEDSASRRFRDTLLLLLSDLGAFLDINLYKEALLHLLGGPDSGIHPVHIIVSGRIVGSQKLCMLSPEIGWHISAIYQHFKTYETHVRRLLNHTGLDKIHWLNFNQRTVTLKTIKK